MFQLCFKFVSQFCDKIGQHMADVHRKKRFSHILPLPYLVPSLDHDDPAGNTFSTLSYTTMIAIEESSLFLNLEWLRPALFVLLIKQRWRGSRCLTA
jgi:hypothetical protein